jgi:hypothetical protein
MPRHCSANSRGAAIPATVRRCAAWSATAPAVLYHPLPYGRRTAPSKKDGGTLEGMTHDYFAPARDSAMMSGQWERSPSSPSALCDHPRHRDAILATASPYPTLWNMRRQDSATPATVPCTASCQRHPRVLTRTALEQATSTPPPRGRSWRRIGHAMMPRQKRDSPGQPSTPWHCTPCLYT